MDVEVELPVQQGDDCVDALHHLRESRKHQFLAMEALPGATDGTAEILITTQRNSRRKPETAIVSCTLATENTPAQSQLLAVKGAMFRVINVQATLEGLVLPEETGCAEGLTTMRQNRLKVVDKAIVALPNDDASAPHIVYYLEGGGENKKTALLLCAQ